MKKSGGEETARTYDAIAEKYRDSTQLPTRVYVDRYTLLCLAGPLEGKSVLDLACGEGHYTRLLKRAGAAEVLGVDISSEMITLAEDMEGAEPLGCRYRVGDVAELNLGEAYDLVVAVYLLNHAAAKPQLVEYCQSIARHLKPGDRFVGLNFNVGLDPAHYEANEKYGFRISTTPDRAEGDPIHLQITNPDDSQVTFDNYYLSPQTYEAAFAEAGLKDFAWEKLSVSPAGLASFPDGYWDAHLAAPATIAMRARK